jgi:5-methyltetrahydrofolate--homocysteine methyltransferase
MSKLPDRFPTLCGGQNPLYLYQGVSSPATCTEQWMCDHPELLCQTQQGYIQAGAAMLAAPTFRLNPAQLEKYALTHEMDDLCQRLIALTRKSAQGKALVGGCLTSLRMEIAPAGDYELEEIYHLYSKQVRTLVSAGADYILFENMRTMQECRMGLLAAKEQCDLPVIISLALDDDGLTAADVNPLSALITLQSMGVSAFGLNSCPVNEMLEYMQELAPHATVPLYARPNACLAEEEGEERVCTPLTPQDFAQWCVRLVEEGVKYLGGGQGATPEYMAAVSQAFSQHTFTQPSYLGDTEHFIATTEKDFFFLDHTVDISPAMECSEDMSEEIIELESDYQYTVAKVGVYHIDDVDFLAQNYYMFNLPLCIETSNIAILEAVCRMYCGRLMIENRGEFDPQMLQYLVDKYGLIVL